MSEGPEDILVGAESEVLAVTKKKMQAGTLGGVARSTDPFRSDLEKVAH